MKLKHFLQLIILFFCVTLPCGFSHADAFSPQEAVSWANDKGKQILSILSSTDSDAKIEALDEILDNDVDLDYAAKFSVGKYWKQMNTAQQQNYVQLFKRYMHTLYKNYPLEIDKGEVTFSTDKAISENNGNISVFCTIFIKKIEQSADKKSKGGIKTIFLLSKENQQIKVRDLKIEESSLLSALRQRFYKMIHEDSEDEISWFLEDFEALVVDNEPPE